MDWAKQPDPFRRYDGASLVRLPLPDVGRALPYWQLYVADNIAPAPLSVDSISIFLRRIAHAFYPPLFQLPQLIAEGDVIPFMNKGKYTFVVDIPPNFQRDVLAGHQPGLQVNVDATAMVQAGLGSGYAQQMITTEIADFLSHSEGGRLSPVNLDVRIAFNPNITTAWFTSVMGIINNVTMLAII